MLDRLIKYGLVLAIAAFFAVMWGLLLKQHFPTLHPATLTPAYAQLLKPGQQSREDSWGVYFAGRRIGKSDVRITRDAEGQFRVRSNTQITIDPAVGLLIGLAGVVDITFEATISPLVGPRDFQVNSDRMHTRIMGTVGEDGIRVIGYVGAERVRALLPASRDLILGEVLSPMTTMPKLSRGDVGRTWSVDMVNPLAGGMQTVTVRVAATREVELAGGRTRVFRLDFNTGNSRWVSWVQQDGELLIQGTPFAVSLRREDLPPAVVEQLEAEQPTKATAP